MIYAGGKFGNDEVNSIGQEFFIKGNLANVDTAGGVYALANPFGEDVFVTDVIIDITTVATAACTLDCGLAANATTKNDGLLDGVDVNAAVILANNRNTAGTNGGIRKWLKDAFLTVSVATGASAGMVGKIFVKAMPVG